MSLTPWLLAPSAIRAGAGADRREARDVVGGALGEHGDRAALAELGLCILEGAAVRLPCSPVDLPVDRDDAGERQEGSDEDHVPERRLGEEPREPAERGDDEDGIGEAVEVVRDDECRPSAVESIEARRLDSAIEAPRRDLRDAQHELIKGPPDHPRSVRRSRPPSG